MVESLINDNKMAVTKMDFVISFTLAFKRSIRRRGEIRMQINGAAVQGQAECWMDPLFV